MSNFNYVINKYRRTGKLVFYRDLTESELRRLIIEFSRCADSDINNCNKEELIQICDNFRSRNLPDKFLGKFSYITASPVIFTNSLINLVRKYGREDMYQFTKEVDWLSSISLEEILAYSDIERIPVLLFGKAYGMFDKDFYNTGKEFCNLLSKCKSFDNWDIIREFAINLINSMNLDTREEV